MSCIYSTFSQNQENGSTAFLFESDALLIVMIKYYQITQSKKVTLSLQYDKKEVRSSVHFLYADKHQSFYKLALSFFMEVARHAQNTQRKLVIFLQFIKKKVSQMQNIHIFYGDPAMFVVTCFSVLLVSQ